MGKQGLVRLTMPSMDIKKKEVIIEVGGVPLEDCLDGKGGSGGGSQGTTDYSALDNKPQINSVELVGNKSASDLGLGTYTKPQDGIPESDLSSDVQQALQKHFKGWLTSTAQLPSNPVVGDYAYVEDNGTTYIYRCTTDGEWPSTSTEEKDPVDVTFASSEEVNETHIDDTNLANPVAGSLAKAEDVKGKISTVKNVNDDFQVRADKNPSAAIINSSNKWGTGWAAYPPVFLKVTPGETLVLSKVEDPNNPGSNLSSGWFAFLKDLDNIEVTTPTTTPHFSEQSGFTGRFAISYFTTGNSVAVVVPSDANYLYRQTHYSSGDYHNNIDRLIWIKELVSFKTEQQLKDVSIIDDLETGGDNNVLSAEQGVVLKGMIDDIQDDIAIYEYSGITSTDSFAKKYINSSGSIETATVSSLSVKEFPVTPQSKVRITSNGHPSSSDYYMYVFYTDKVASGGVVVGNIGPAMKTAQDSYEVNVPEGATYIYVGKYNSTSHVSVERMTNISAQEFYDSTKAFESSYKNKLAYSFVDNSLYIAYNNGHGIEVCYWFKKCMANELFTFFKVGYRDVDRLIPSTDGIIGSFSALTLINDTVSDNIGPISINGSWIGGNHTYTNNSVEYKTAETTATYIYVDGFLLSEENSGIAESITIKVNNTLFNTGVLPQEGDILTDPLIYETVTYVICKNNIEVAVQHKFVNDATGTISVYHGMQSMFKTEDYFLTPNGAYSSAWQANGEYSFTKSDYPSFNRFIEKKTSGGYYQATYLVPTFSLGAHSKLAGSDDIFIKTAGSANKAYHNVIVSSTITGGMVMQWAGVYTFLTSAMVVDDSDIFAYLGCVNGKEALFVNSLQACEKNIPIPAELAFRKISIIENTGFTNEDDGTDMYIGGDGLYVKCSGTASLIVSFD